MITNNIVMWETLQNNTDWDCFKELTLKVNITKEFTIAFSETESIVNHNSQLAGPSKCIEMDELAKKDRKYRLSTEEFKRYQGQGISP